MMALGHYRPALRSESRQIVPLDPPDPPDPLDTTHGPLKLEERVRTTGGPAFFLRESQGSRASHADAAVVPVETEEISIESSPALASLSRERATDLRASIVYASFWRRAASATIDFLPGLILFIVSFALLPEDETEDPSGLALALFYLPLIVQTAHATIAWTLWGQTLGYKIFGLRVVTTDIRTLDFKLALRRCIALYVASVSIYGLLKMAFRKDARPWHDEWTDTIVVRVARDTT